MDTSRILQEMGVDVWRLRRPAETRRESQESAEQGARLSAQPVDQTTTQTQIPVAQPTPVSAPAVAVAVEPLAPFQVLSLSLAGALWLARPTDVTAGGRFGKDLLRAATGRWERGVEFRLLQFSWPQPGIVNSAPSMKKALGAFIEKQCADATNDGAGLVLIGAELVELAGDRAADRIPENAVVLPASDELMQDGRIKREVWIRLSGWAKKGPDSAR